MTDNTAHKTLFTIPEPCYSTALATVKPLPVQRKITGNKQVDAYLWVLAVIKTNEPAHLEAAEEALKKLKITPKEAQQKYSDYLMKSGAHPFQIAFGSMSMDNPQGYIDRAKAQIKKASQVRASFSSYEVALELTEPEKLMLVGELAGIYEPFYYWNETEQAEGCMHGDRINETDKLRQATAKGFAEQLPEPHTLSDVVREFLYWDWLYQMRNVAADELDPGGYGDERYYIYDREDYIEKKLATIQPVNRQEAIDVCKWVLEEERFHDRELTDKIILNLVGECANA
ncbi:helix-turn-helix domain-containing protein [Xenorhabdus sp. XENO-1]|uniref:helix-turn-helix domain-containing protein n=1 Tax=Xenorhabdus bovienii TaxID=40576 RepID=UPI0020CA9BCE|nr:helix-turn-helix domain-containing protein [Xenorhabdus bovienii]MCP9270367.1 helix-turn-helix domain-containing protein [Xenorhabdus bovienii subsp. africana]